MDCWTNMDLDLPMPSSNVMDVPTNMNPRCPCKDITKLFTWMRNSNVTSAKNPLRIQDTWGIIKGQNTWESSTIVNIVGNSSILKSVSNHMSRNVLWNKFNFITKAMKMFTSLLVSPKHSQVLWPRKLKLWNVCLALCLQSTAKSFNLGSWNFEMSVLLCVCNLRPSLLN